MVIPKGKVVHEDLSTSYTDINELLKEKKQSLKAFKKLLERAEQIGK